MLLKQVMSSLCLSTKNWGHNSKTGGLFSSPFIFKKGKKMNTKELYIEEVNSFDNSTSVDVDFNELSKRLNCVIRIDPHTLNVYLHKPMLYQPDTMHLRGKKYDVKEYFPNSIPVVLCLEFRNTNGVKYIHNSVATFAIENDEFWVFRHYHGRNRTNRREYEGQCNGSLKFLVIELSELTREKLEDYVKYVETLSKTINADSPTNSSPYGLPTIDELRVSPSEKLIGVFSSERSNNNDDDEEEDDENTSYCNSCGGRINTENDGYEIAFDEIYCQSCYAESFAECYDCNEVMERDCTCSDEDGNDYCEDCYAERYIKTCPHCDDTVNIDTDDYQEDGNDYYHESCYAEAFYVSCANCDDSFDSNNEGQQDGDNLFCCSSCAEEWELKHTCKQCDEHFDDDMGYEDNGNWFCSNDCIEKWDEANDEPPEPPEPLNDSYDDVINYLAEGEMKC